MSINLDSIYTDVVIDLGWKVSFDKLKINKIKFLILNFQKIKDFQKIYDVKFFN
jgi:hypothetical protein